MLNLSNNFIVDAKELKFLTKLKELSLEFTELEDVSFLENLINLKNVRLAHNKITDISSLRGLVNLEHVDLSNNKIKNVSPLSNLTQLVKLDLAENQITDVSALKSLVEIGFDIQLDGQKIFLSEFDELEIRNENGRRISVKSVNYDLSNIEGKEVTIARFGGKQSIFNGRIILSV